MVSSCDHSNEKHIKVQLYFMTASAVGRRGILPFIFLLSLLSASTGLSLHLTTFLLSVSAMSFFCCLRLSTRLLPCQLSSHSTGPAACSFAFCSSGPSAPCPLPLVPISPGWWLYSGVTSIGLAGTDFFFFFFISNLNKN